VRNLEDFNQPQVWPPLARCSDLLSFERLDFYFPASRQALGHAGAWREQEVGGLNGRSVLLGTVRTSHFTTEDRARQSRARTPPTWVKWISNIILSTLRAPRYPTSPHAKTSHPRTTSQHIAFQRLPRREPQWALLASTMARAVA
jgi:hypothetical protein